jgi:hypothetical protein
MSVHGFGEGGGMSVGAGVDVEVGAARAQIVLKKTTQAPPLADVISVYRSRSTGIFTQVYVYCKQ